jgi:phosphatidylglycerophosphatase A
MNKIWIAIATFFGCGFLPIAPGTWASAFTVIIVYFSPLSGSPFLLLAGATATVYAIGVPAAKASEVHFARKDPRPCVIDEVAGQLVSLWFLPRQAGYFIAAFFLFRLFDIIKPFPVNKSESLPHGFGIMTDDVLAGGYTLAVLLLARRFLFS